MQKKKIPLAGDLASRDYSLSQDWLISNGMIEQEKDGRISVRKRFGYGEFQNFTPSKALGVFQFNNQILSIFGNSVYLGTTLLTNTFSTSSGQADFSLTLLNSTFFLKNTTQAFYYSAGVLNPVTNVNYPSNTVRGAVNLNGTTYVMDTDGKIWGSAINDPSSWTALNFISAQIFPSRPVGIFRLYNNVVAFMDNNTQFFYDNGNPVGSPLSTLISAGVNIGCASAGSIVQTENTIFFIGRTQQKGRRVYAFTQMQPTPISNPVIDRVLNKDSLEDVSAFYVEIVGNAFYVLNLPNSDKTLVYNSTNNTWNVWESLVFKKTFTAEKVDVFNEVVTITYQNHGIQPGEIISVRSPISGVSGVFVPEIVNANVFRYPIGFPPFGSKYGGINTLTLNTFAINQEYATPLSDGDTVVLVYRRGRFNANYYVNNGDLDILQDKDNGLLYSISSDYSTDLNIPIPLTIRTSFLDFGTNNLKIYPHVELIADKVSEYCYLRYYDDDSFNGSVVKSMNMAAKRTQLWRLSLSRKRSWELNVLGSGTPRLFDLEVTFDICPL